MLLVCAAKGLVHDNVLFTLQRKVGEAKLGQLCNEGEFHTEKFLAADPEFDAPETPDVAAFLKQEGLSAVPL